MAKFTGIINNINFGGVKLKMTSNYLPLFLNNEGNQFLAMILAYVVIFAGLYFILFRPQQKKKKQEEEMRNALQIGDNVTTIGGIVGRIVSIKSESDSLIIETSVDRSKLHIKNWAIASRDNIIENEKSKEKAK